MVVTNKGKTARFEGEFRDRVADARTVVEAIGKNANWDVVFWDIVSQYGDVNSLIRSIYMEAQNQKLNGVKVLQDLSRVYSDFSARQAGMGGAGITKNSERKTLYDLESRTGDSQAAGFKPGQTGVSYKDPKTGKEAAQESRLATNYWNEAGQRLDQLFGE